MLLSGALRFDAWRSVRYGQRLRRPPYPTVTSTSLPSRFKNAESEAPIGLLPFLLDQWHFEQSLERESKPNELRVRGQGPGRKYGLDNHS